MGVTLASHGDIEYIKETTYGAGLPASGQLEIPSDSVLSSELRVERTVNRHGTISSHSPVDTTYHTKTYTLTIEGLVQQCNTTGQFTNDETLQYYAVTRSAGDLHSLAFIYDTNGSAYQLYGAKVGRYEENCTIDDAIRFTAEIWGNSLQVEADPSDFTNYGTPNCTESSAIGNTIEIYEGASITRSGDWANGITDFNWHIDNGLERLGKMGSYDYSGVYPVGVVDVGGTVNILTDSGGSVDVNDLLGGNETAIVMETGSTTSQSYKYTFTNASYNSMPVPYRTDMTAMLIAADWGSEGVTYTVVT